MVYTKNLAPTIYRRSKDEALLLFASIRIAFALARTRAGSRHRSCRQSDRGWSAEDTGVAGGDGWPIRIVSQCQLRGLASHEARDADCHTVWGHPAASSGEDAGRRAPAVDVFRGLRWQRKISSEWRELHFVREGYWRRRVVPALSLRRGYGRRNAVDRREVAEFDRTVVVERRSDRLHVHSAHRERYGFVGDESERSKDGSFADAVSRGRMAAAGLVPG